MTLEVSHLLNSFGQGAYDFSLPWNFGDGGDINIRITAGLICANPSFTFDPANCWFAVYIAQVNRGSINTDLVPVSGSGFTYAPGSLITTYGNWDFAGADPTIYLPAKTFIATKIPQDYSVTISGNNKSGSVGTGGAILRAFGSGAFQNGEFTNENGSDVNANLMARWVGQSGGFDVSNNPTVPQGSQPLKANQIASLIVQLNALGTGGFLIQAIITKISIQTFGNDWTDLNLTNGYVGFGDEFNAAEAISPQMPLSFDPGSADPQPVGNARNLYLLNPQTKTDIPIGPALIPLPKPVYAKPVGLFYPWGGK